MGTFQGEGAESTYAQPGKRIDQELRKKNIRYISFILSPFSFAIANKKNPENLIN